MKTPSIHNHSLCFSPMPKLFSKAEVSAIDKYMTTAIADGLCQFVDGELEEDGKYEYQSEYVLNPTWAEAMGFCQQAKFSLEDTHHVFTEEVEIVGTKWLPAKDLGIKLGGNGERKVGVTQIRVWCGS